MARLADSKQLSLEAAAEAEPIEAICGGCGWHSKCPYAWAVNGNLWIRKICPKLRTDLKRALIK